ncbi:MAG: lysophospholipase [Bacteroidales bacterium]|nr:lysophospholipase [Bacteroidales bacterium]
MKEETYYWKSNDGLNIFARYWQPQSNPKAIIVFIHGIGEHSGRYDQWAKKFIDNNFLFYSYDLRGHGKSQGRRGHANSYRLLFADIEQGISEAKKLFPNIPVFLYGHSFGGNQVLNYIINKNNGADGLIITSPWLKPVISFDGLSLFLIHTLQQFMPRMLVSNRIDNKDLSRNSDVGNKVDQDELCHDRISLRLFTLAYDKGIKASKSIYKINLPMLLMHGDADNITSYRASKDFVQNAGPYTKFISWDGAYHELHNEINNEEVFASVLNWLDEQMVAKKSK